MRSSPFASAPPETDCNNPPFSAANELCCGGVDRFEDPTGRFWDCVNLLSCSGLTMAHNPQGRLSRGGYVRYDADHQYWVPVTINGGNISSGEDVCTAMCPHARGDAVAVAESLLDPTSPATADKKFQCLCHGQRWATEGAGAVHRDPKTGKATWTQGLPPGVHPLISYPEDECACDAPALPPVGRPRLTPARSLADFEATLPSTCVHNCMVDAAFKWVFTTPNLGPDYLSEIKRTFPHINCYSILHGGTAPTTTSALPTTTTGDECGSAAVTYAEAEAEAEAEAAAAQAARGLAGAGTTGDDDDAGSGQYCSHGCKVAVPGAVKQCPT